MICLTPTSIEQLKHAVQENESVQIKGTGTKLCRELNVEGSISLESLTGVLELRPPDLTCSVRAGTTMVELQGALAGHGLCIPTADLTGTAGGAYMAHQGKGRWKDWTIGATFMLADGTVAKSGSHAVKSVAGYDVHRFMAGTLGSLGICLELILRVYPISAMPIDEPARESPAHVVDDPIQIGLMKRAKSIFDPTNKLNPGVWGFM